VAKGCGARVGTRSASPRCPGQPRIFSSPSYLRGRDELPRCWPAGSIGGRPQPSERVEERGEGGGEQGFSVFTRHRVSISTPTAIFISLSSLPTSCFGCRRGGFDSRATMNRYYWENLPGMCCTEIASNRLCAVHSKLAFGWTNFDRPSPVRPSLA
jgi:hypothetical protein